MTAETSVLAHERYCQALLNFIMHVTRLQLSEDKTCMFNYDVKLKLPVTGHEESEGDVTLGFHTS